MTPFDRSALGHLTVKLTELRDQRAAELVAVVATDYADYRGRAAYVRALTDVLEMTQIIVKDMVGR